MKILQPLYNFRTWLENDLFKSYSQLFPKMFLIFFWLVHDMFTTCSQFVHDLVMTCPCLAHDLFMTCSWMAHYLFMTFSTISSILCKFTNPLELLHYIILLYLLSLHYCFELILFHSKYFHFIYLTWSTSHLQRCDFT